MKKLALLCAVTLLAYGAQAQTSKGTVVLTGKTGYTQYKGENEKKYEGNDYGAEGYSYTLSPSLGVFIKDNLEIGTSLNFSRYKGENFNSTPSYTNSLIAEGREKNFSIYAKQYKFLTERLAVHGTLSAGLGKSEKTLVSTYLNTYSSQSSDQHEKTTSFTFGVSPGVTFFASDKIGLTASLGTLSYSRSKDIRENAFSNIMYPPHSPYRNDYSYKTNRLQLDFSSMYLNFGISYFLGR
jgi:hypothetical protein